MLENGSRVINNRIIKLISQTFDINEEWLKNGIEPIFIKNEEMDLLDQLKDKYSLTTDSLTLIQNYIALSSDDRTIFDNYLKKIVGVEKYNQAE